MSAEWEACDDPERPPDADMVWGWDCKPCEMKKRAVRAQGGDVAAHPIRLIVELVSMVDQRTR